MIIYLFLKVLILQIILFPFCKCENEVLKVLEDSNENLLFLATIDGNIHLINRYSGELKWTTKLYPFIKTTSSNGSMLIPNPISGQLYIYHRNENNKEVFSALEYNVYEYVKRTPFFMENLLLTGSKSDQWISIDIGSGEIIHKYQTGNIENCPQNRNEKDQINRTMHIGICQYNLVVSDPINRQIIHNVVLNSLATHAVTDVDEYNMRHYASSDSGLVITKYMTNDVETSWSLTLESSVIGLYSITPQGILNRLQFTSMSHNTLSELFHAGRPWNYNHQISLKKAMFFGQSINSWYVLKTFIHQNNKVKSSTRKRFPLITGPVNGSTKYQYPSDINDDSDINGFYEIPADGYFTHQNRVMPTNYFLDFDRNEINTALVSKEVDRNNYSKSTSSRLDRDTIQLQLLSVLVGATFLIVSYIAFFLTRQKSIALRSIGYSDMTVTEATGTRFDNDDIVVGDLRYSPKEILGHGTNGTAVFRGVFLGNDRPVAVKRLLKSARSHYELQFLRQSFDCSHLIKCFYITQSREFTYLALELCECTLEEYASDSRFQQACCLDKMSVCKQIILGVSFLHEKGIVHRDLKPRNILLLKQHSRPQLRLGAGPNASDTSSAGAGALNIDPPFQYKIVISDFGLSRQGVDCGVSITKTGGGGGTSGYMAPELGRDDVTRISISADIFSCGILFYYVFTEGLHPFGDEVLSRQHHIHQGVSRIDPDRIPDRVLLYFISSMLRACPADRPSATEILQGPLFWKPITKLSFLCDVSDFLEKNEFSLNMSLDQKSALVFPCRWTDRLEPEFVANLTVQRTYKTRTLSHLIRALRNKRNHFHELPPELSERLFASNVSGLAEYVNARFPSLYAVLYEWVRSRLDQFADSIQQYFPGAVLDSPRSHGDAAIDGGAETPHSGPPSEPDTGELLEWRKAKRKRPNQPKKCRGTGSRYEKKSIL